MDVSYFCIHRCKPNELVAVREKEYVVGTVYIDSDGLFRVPNGYAARQVKGDSYGIIPIKYASKSDNGLEYKKEYVHCHFVDVK